jgi:hypothetical protein
MTAVRQQGIGEQLDLFDEALKATMCHGGPSPGRAEARAREEQQADTAWQRERALTRGSRVHSPGKPPWYVIRMPGGVRGGDREEPPYSIAPAAQSVQGG